MAANLCGMTPRTGRPRLDNPRREIVRFRVTADELARLAAAAEKASQVVADYCRDRALSASKRTR